MEIRFGVRLDQIKLTLAYSTFVWPTTPGVLNLLFFNSLSWGTDTKKKWGHSPAPLTRSISWPEYGVSRLKHQVYSLKRKDLGLSPSGFVESFFKGELVLQGLGFRVGTPPPLLSQVGLPPTCDNTFSFFFDLRRPRSGLIFFYRLIHRFVVLHRVIHYLLISLFFRFFFAAGRSFFFKFSCSRVCFCCIYFPLFS